MHLDVHLGQFRQGAVHDQPLVEQAGGSLDDVGAEAARHAHGIVGGVDGDADVLEQALVAQGLHAVPHRCAMGREEIARLLHQERMGAVDAQPRQGSARLGLDMVGTAVAPGGLDHQVERTGTRRQLADHAFGTAADDRVEHAEPRTRADLQDVGDFLFRRAATRIGHRVVKPELRGRKAELGAPIVCARHGVLHSPTIG